MFMILERIAGDGHAPGSWKSVADVNNFDTRAAANNWLLVWGGRGTYYMVVEETAWRSVEIGRLICTHDMGAN